MSNKSVEVDCKCGRQCRGFLNLTGNVIVADSGNGHESIVVVPTWMADAIREAHAKQNIPTTLPDSVWDLLRNDGPELTEEDLS